MTTRKKLLLFLLFSIFFSPLTKAMYKSFHIALKVPESKKWMNEKMKDSIWTSYVRLTEGGWVNYTFKNENSVDHPMLHVDAKRFSRELCSYFGKKGLESKNVIIKYSPNASVFVHKENGGKISANYLDLDEKDKQVFVFKNSTGAVCETRAGNKFVVPPLAFRTAEDSEIQVEMYEMLTQRGFVKTGYTSSAQGRLLESRGMYRINAFSNGNEVKLRHNTTCEMKYKKDNFPTPSEATTFNTFYGKEKKGIVDWTSNNWQKISSSEPRDFDAPEVKSEQPGYRITRKVTYTETKYVQLCRKIHLLEKDMMKNSENCLLNRRQYKMLVAKYGKFNVFRERDLTDINSYNAYLLLANKDPNRVLLPLSKEQSNDLTNAENEERAIAKSEAEERQRKYEEEQAALEAERIRLKEKELKEFPISMKISKLGDINCDRFNGTEDKTDVIVQLNESNYDEIRVYAVFNDIKSVINGYYRKEHKGTIVFENLPTGKNVTYIAATFKGDDVKLAYLSKPIEEDDNLKLALQSYSLDNYNRILDDLIPN